VIFVTGATGFVGGALVRRLSVDGALGPVKVAIRRADNTDINQPPNVHSIQVSDLTPKTDWTAALQDVEKVVHLAARVHIMNDPNTDPLAEFRRVNVEGTVNLARQAAAAGVKRFIFLSSVKVNGEFTKPNSPFDAADTPAPVDPYGVSKFEAERALLGIAAETGMEVVIIRPPLVYGAGVKANFESMMRWLVQGVPLPLAGVTENRRSLVALDNLVDLIVTCLTHPAAANQTFLVSDGEDLSTAALLRRMGEAQGSPARLFYAPASALELGAAMLGKRSIYQRLCGSLQVDIRKTRELLSWAPPVTVAEGLRRAAAGFRG
jgi:nucleoside-diphosphate-sugar epimerase